MGDAWNMNTIRALYPIEGHTHVDQLLYASGSPLKRFESKPDDWRVAFFEHASPRARLRLHAQRQASRCEGGEDPAGSRSRGFPGDSPEARALVLVGSRDVSSLFFLASTSSWSSEARRGSFQTIGPETVLNQTSGSPPIGKSLRDVKRGVNNCL